MCYDGFFSLSLIHLFAIFCFQSQFKDFSNGFLRQREREKERERESEKEREREREREIE